MWVGNDSTLILIGKRTGRQELQFTSKPRFFDAVQLSIQAVHHDKDASYQSFPLDEDTTIIFHYHDISIRLTLDQQSRLKIESETPLTEAEVFEVLANFVLKDGSKVSYLSFPPIDKHSTRKNKKLNYSSEAKRQEHLAPPSDDLELKNE
jgi:hypothetical protein